MTKKLMYRGCEEIIENKKLIKKLKKPHLTRPVGDKFEGVQMKELNLLPSALHLRGR